MLHEEVLFGLALDKNDGSKPSFLKFDFVDKKQKLPEDFEYEYDSIVISQRKISYEEFKEILGRIGEGKTIGRSSESPLVSVGGWDSRYIPSNETWGSILPDFPTLYIQGRMNQAKSGRISSENILGNNNPPFPNATKAFAHLFGLRIDWNLTDPVFFIVVPDVRARIKQVKISGQKVQAEIESEKFQDSELKVQFYIESEHNTKTDRGVEIKKGISTFEFEGEINHILVVLITKNGHLLDKKEISMKYRRPDPTVLLETPEYSLRELILQGEGKHIEFKEKLLNVEPFVSSVIAFANTDGGRIFVGVDDHGKIKGIKSEDTEEKIMEWIAQYCDPRIDVIVQHSKDLGIIVVEVPVGNKRPYFLKTGGCFIRHGATDRQATRVEQEQMKGTKSDTVGEQYLA